ncbi:MAG: hypothetical protein Q8Q09_05055 [Deltaproteobacteria bacterium]|nr:hypothetical protein [Deltaproteobacteria bacterium]
MRNQVFVQEQHLLEAVRRKVITEHQMEEVLGISRAMGHTGGVADLGWLNIVQGVIISGIAGIPALFTLAYMHRGHESEALVFSVIAIAGLSTAAFLLKRWGLGKAATGLALQGAALWCWGLGAAFCGVFVLQNAFHSSYSDNFDYNAFHARQQLAYIAGDVALIVGSLVLGRLFRSPTTGLTAVLGIFGLVINAGEYYFRTSNNSHSLRDMDAAGLMLLTAIAVSLAAFAIDRAMKKSRHDLGFWLHAGVILPLGIAGIIMVDKEAATALPWTIAAMATVVLGTVTDRKAYILAGCTGIMVYLPFGVKEAHMGDSAVGFAFMVAAALVAGIVFAVRTVYVSRAAQGIGESTQSVWD